MRYADPSLCPDCRSPLPTGVSVCPACDLLVRHPLAVDLFGTLQRADGLLARLRTASDTVPARPAPVPASSGSGLGGPLAPPAAPVPPKRATTGLPAYPGPVPPPPAPPAAPGRPGAPFAPAAPSPAGISSASVPKILLGLGAFCLLVAAVIFLAVSWSALGVGGRTAVLAGLTLTAGASALLLHRIGLRIAGESLVVVALGLLALDVVGAGAAGWFGEGPDSAIVCAAGLVVALAGAGLGLVRVGGQPRLAAPQVIAGIGLFIGYVGAAAATDHWLIAGHAVTAVGLGLVVLGRRAGASVLLWSAAAAAGVTWLCTAGAAFAESVATPDLRQLWVEGTGWSLLVSAAALLLPGALVRHRDLLLAGASGAAMLVTVVVTLPSVDTDARTVGLVALGTTAAWVLALGVLPRRARIVAIAPAGTGCLVLVGLVLRAVADVLDRWSQVAGVFERPWAVRLTTPEPATEPALLVPSLLIVLACVALVDRERARRALPAWSRFAGLVAGVGLAATLASYDLALAAPLGVLALVALGAAVLALTTTGSETTVWALVATILTAAVAMAALPSEALVLVTVAPLAVALVAVAVLGRQQPTRVVGGLGAPAALGLATAAAVIVVGDDAAWVSIPVLLVVGVLALALPRVDVELSAITVGLLALPVSLSTTTDPGGFTALWLTVAGFLASGTALLHASRRGCVFVGGALLLLASWVRLADLNVTEPEPYTVPLAAALLAFGLWRLRRSAQVGTLEALLPGLLLATVPSLIWVLGDPVSLRALILGGVCLALTVAGAAMRWSAPLVVGAGVGAVVVLRELGPYAGEFPKWVWIGLAGALLTVVGITWERRLLDVRRAVGLLGRLR
ncbi:SCO7613 C-terminal domain-containing membrane protein [Nocardioides sp. BYT-33-1]|uniref:SCO7613 C-terminal domain-containing membrane protein n=1 Tax=Nocardioides sp. BYT-33-1 TaxID=3416952 RepID=UPI003F5386D4